MADTLSPPDDQALSDARWDLEPLVEGGGRDGAIELLEEAARLSDDFASRYRGGVADLDAAGLAAALAELEDIFDRVGRAGSYASLAFSVDTQDAPTGALMQQVSERSASIETALLFFDLEWNELDDAHAEKLLEADERGMWAASPEALATLRDAILEAEGWEERR